MDDLGVTTKLTIGQVRAIRKGGIPMSQDILDLCDDWLKWYEEFKLLQAANQGTRSDLHDALQENSRKYHLLKLAEQVIETIVAETDSEKIKEYCQEFLGKMK